MVQSVELACGHSKVCAWSCGAKSTLLLLAQKIRSMKRFALDVGLPRVFPVRHVHSFTDHRRHDGIIMIARRFWKMTRTSCHMILCGATRYSSDGTPTKSHINRNANHTSDLVTNQNRIQCSNEQKVGSSFFWLTFSAVRAKK